MPMFLGEYQPNVTEGARVALPRRLRVSVRGQEVILARGFERCILGYDKQEWQQEAQKQEESSISNVKARKLKRYLYSQAAEVSFDKQGRFVIPASLKTYAGIKNRLTVIGAGDHFEIWDGKVWSKHLSGLEKEVGQE